jgi:hypothetical protein
MDRQTSEIRSRALLKSFMEATDEAEAQRFLERLIDEHALSVIDGILKHRWLEHPRDAASSNRRRTQSTGELDAEDIRSTVVAQLVKRLKALRADAAGDTIRDFPAYVAGTTRRACDDELQKRYPRRDRLKRKLRYVLTHQPGFALWEGGDGEPLGGFDEWREQPKTLPHARRAQALREDPQHFAKSCLAGGTAAGMELADLLEAIFNWLGGPLPLVLLVTVSAELLGIKDPVPAAPTEQESLDETLVGQPDPQVDVAGEVVARESLQELWTEIRELVLPQRVALLLNLRDERGRGVIDLLPLRRIATIREIAGALEMPDEQLAALWNRLPLNDDTIADHLGLSRQQVINLRKAARARLVRRMKPFDGEA